MILISTNNLYKDYLLWLTLTDYLALPRRHIAISRNLPWNNIIIPNKCGSCAIMDSTHNKIMEILNDKPIWTNFSTNHKTNYGLHWLSPNNLKNLQS